MKRVCEWDGPGWYGFYYDKPCLVFVRVASWNVHWTQANQFAWLVGLSTPYRLVEEPLWS